MTAFFARDGDTVRPTEHTASPWNPATQAGGAPAALLAQLIEERARPELRTARATVDILGPIPLEPGDVEVRTVRQGRATEFVVAALTIGGSERVRVSTWRVAPAPTLPDDVLLDQRAPLAPGPDELADHEPPAALFAPVGYVAAMQWRLVHGAFDAPGPGAAWSRPRYPLVPDTVVPPVARLLLAGATANGLSGVLDPGRFLTIDIEYSVHLSRDPAGTWLGIDARTHLADGQAGHVTCTFHDENGPLGSGAQTLLVAPRDPARTR